jgi:cell division protein FtsZ
MREKLKKKKQNKFKTIVQIDFTNVHNYYINQELLNGNEIIFIKIDFSIDKNVDKYILLSKIAKQKKILPLFVLLNLPKERTKIFKELKNEIYFTVESDVIFKSLYKEIVGAITARGESDISLDIADLKTIFAHKGLAFFGTAKTSSKDAVLLAIKEALKSAQIKDKSLSDMQGVLIYFSIHPDYEMMKLAHAMEILYEQTHYDAEIIWGTTTDKSLSKEFVKAVVLLSGSKS